MKTIYTIPSPLSTSEIIEVYGDPENGLYEWRVIDGDLTVWDTATHEGYSRFQGSQYGNAEMALRDALMFASVQLIDDGDGDTPTAAGKAKAERA